MTIKKSLSHIDSAGNPRMVNVADKSVTKRVARARATVVLGKEVMALLQHDEINTKKGPVFQTAVIAGIMGAKRTAELIPLCHPLGLEDCDVKISVVGDSAVVDATAVVSGKTGVEMEALTAASVAALTIYDMCKAISHDIVITDVRLMEKRGGKSDFLRS